MPKRYNRSNEYTYGYEDEYDDRFSQQEMKQRRKIKRMKNALKSKNIHDLLEFDDEY